jgi:hypothetical protein
MTTTNSQGRVQQNELHRTFIAMLFAFVAAVVAQQIAEHLIVATNSWKLAYSPNAMYERLKGDGLYLVAAFSHSALALLMLTMSWIMWSKSQGGGNRPDITSVFSVKFLIVLIEVFLVVLYFAVAKTNEANIATYDEELGLRSYVKTASAYPEAVQILWIFAIFLIWDIIVDVLASRRSSPAVGLLNRTVAVGQGVLTYCSVSALCLVGGIAIVKQAPLYGSPTQAISGDIALIALLLFFNIGKSFEYYFRDWMPKEKLRDNTARSMPPKTWELATIGGLILVYVVSLMIMVLSHDT